MGIESGQPDNALPERRSPSSSSGFTLIELLVTIGIAAVLAAVAIPSFRDFYRDNRLATQSNDFLAALSLARSEAMRRGVRVTLCKSADPSAATPACTTAGSWQQGWVVFADIDKDGVIDANETIRANPALTAATLTVTVDNIFSNWIYFLPDGTALGNGGKPSESSGFTLCNAGVSRVITVNARGRARVVAGAC